jgi:hypothetical protein
MVKNAKNVQKQPFWAPRKIEKKEGFFGLFTKGENPLSTKKRPKTGGYTGDPKNRIF